tara:strand:+ start:4072 stop:6537 length:2466 start_codon:yes stop_codon:yes gene_type:complete
MAAIDYNTLQHIKLDKFINIEYLSNNLNNNNGDSHIYINLFGKIINTEQLMIKTFTYYDNEIINKSKFIELFEMKTDNYIYLNNYSVFIDLYIITNIYFVNYYDIIIENNVKNIINLNINLNDYIKIINLCNKYNINISNIIQNINTLSDFNKLELNINYDIYKNANDINEVLNIFTNILQNLSSFNEIYIYNNIIQKFLNKLNDDSKFIVDNLITKLYKNNIVYDIYKHDYNRLFDDFILNKSFKNEHKEHILSTRKNIEEMSKKTYNINMDDIKRYMNFNKKINIYKFNVFIYEFNRYKVLNNLIPDNINLSNNTDLIKILCIKPKLLFESTSLIIINNLLYTKKHENITLVRNLIILSFHILYSMLNKDIESYMLYKAHDFNKINQNSPYIHKLSKIGKHLTSHVIMKHDNLFRYIEPITYGYCVNVKYLKEDKKTNNDIDYKYVYNNKNTCLSTTTSSLLSYPRPNVYNAPINTYMKSYSLLNEYTLGLFTKNFNYHANYKPYKYDVNTPKVMLTGSMIGPYCLSGNINKQAFNDSDIDIGVVDPYLIYYVKHNIINNLKSLNNFNINLYKQFLHKLLCKKTSNVIINNIYTFIIKPKSEISYKLVFPTTGSKEIYSNIHYEETLKPILNKIYNKFNINNYDNIKNIINTFLFIDYNYVQNTKICLNDIYYYSNMYKLTKYRDIDLYISSLTKISLYHEPVVRACFVNGDFLIFSDCLNSILTNTSIDYRAVCGKKTPIDIMLKKHKQCVSNRIFSNIDKLTDFINGVALANNIYLNDNILYNLITFIKNTKKTYNKSIEINIGNRCLITIYYNRFY